MLNNYFRLAAGLTFFAAISINGAQAQQIWFNPFTDPDPYAWQPTEEQSQPPARSTVTNSPPPREVAPAKKSLSIIEASTPMANRLKDMPQMKILGLWVGNVKYKVGSADGRLYLIAADGGLKLLPTKTNPDTITIPEDSPIVNQLFNQTSNNEQSSNGNNGASPNEPNKPKIVVGQTGLLHPTVVGTRTTMIGGKPMVVAGAIISEWATPKDEVSMAPPPQAATQVERHTHAMVRTGKKTAKSHHKHKT